MPKVVITEQNIPLALHTLDKWQGKLTWDLYCEKLAEVLGIEGGISRHTLLNYPQITQAFGLKKDQIKEKKNKGIVDGDVTIAKLRVENETLVAKINRLEKQVNDYKEQFVRWQHNLYMMPGVDLEKLDTEMDKPLTPVSRSAE